MIKQIFHLSDLHIRNYLRLEEYAEQLYRLIEKLRDLTKDLNKEEIRIVISGDLIHQKNQISPELMSFTSTFLRQLEQIAKVIVIAGNHDLILNNTSRKDAISSIFETAQFDNVFFLDMMLDYKSGCIDDENVKWAVYSIYDNYTRPTIEDNPENRKVIGLFHGAINGAKLFNNTNIDNGINIDIFDGCDFVIAGDIHKPQVLKHEAIPIVYSGSLIQQNFGEGVSNHGFVLWDVETETYKFIRLEADRHLFDISIEDFDDIDNDKEILNNK